MLRFFPKTAKCALSRSVVSITEVEDVATRLKKQAEANPRLNRVYEAMMQNIKKRTEDPNYKPLPSADTSKLGEVLAQAEERYQSFSVYG